MIRHTLAALALMSIVGCSTTTSITPLAGSDTEHAQLAAYAASNKFPADLKPSSDLNVGAITNPGDGKVKLVNFADQPVRDARIWVNGLYVYRVEMIPGHGSVSIKESDFFDSTGNNMATLKAFPTKIQLEITDHLYNVANATMQ